MKRGRPTKLSARVTKRIVAHPEQAWTKKPPVRWRKFLTPRSTNGKHVGKPVKNPFASFFSVISRTRDCHKARRLKIVLDAAEGLLPPHADWKAASWLLEKRFAA